MTSFLSSFKEIERKVLYLLALISFIVLFAILNFIVSPLFLQNKRHEQELAYSIFQVTDEVSNFDFPYAELTIPYLRSRTFESALSVLEKKAEVATYTSHRASYDSEGLEIFGQLTVPKGEQPQGGWPAIVFVHGYIPPSQYQTFEKYVAYVDYLAKNGFVVFKIDLRGHGESEGEPGGAYFSSDYIIDVLNAYAALEVADFVDGQRIGLWGHSMAGNVVARTLAVKPKIPAAVIWAGAGFTYDDFFKYRISDGSYQRPAADSARSKRRQEMFDTVGEYDSESSFWSQVSPVQYLSDVTGSVQLHHAVDDTVVDIGYSRDFINNLDEHGVQAELFEYPSGGHNISGSSFNLAMQRTVDFFGQKL